jgi:prefoldin subunit 5
MTNRHRLERLQTQIADLQEKLNRIDERVNESEMVRKDLEEIALMEKYNAKL